MNFSKVHMRMRPDQVKAFDLCEAIKKGNDVTVGFLHDLGVTFDEADENIGKMTEIAKEVFAQDAAETAPTIAAGVQFLQHFLSKTIHVITEARVIDKLVGRTIAGEWHDEEIMQPVVEHTGSVTEYSDNADFRLAGFNPTFKKSTIVRFEGGLQTGKLEEARVAAMKLRTSAYDAKRAALGLAFAINTNDIGFNGWNNGANTTYGILNNPDISEAVSITLGSTFQTVTAAIRTIVSALRVKSGDNFDPATDAFTMGFASSLVDNLDTTSDMGISVRDWVKKTYPKSRIVSVPQFDTANGGAKVIMFILDTIAGESCVDQYIPATMRLLGTDRRAKGIREDYTNATAGILVSHGEGVVKYSVA